MQTTLYHSSREADYYRHETGLVFVHYKTKRKSNSMCHVSNDEAGYKFIEGLKKLFPQYSFNHLFRCPKDGQKYPHNMSGQVLKKNAKVIDIRVRYS